MSDSFLSSMTFAGHDFRSNIASCDCDECGVNIHIPPPILAALRERKRQKLEQSPIKRTQARTLVQRGPDNFAVWHWILPRGAEPLVEFGSSHRIVWVQRLDNSNFMRSIGKGIIGSNDEERSRTDLSWEEGDVYLVASNGGKAVGWIHHAHEASGGVTSTEKTNEGHAELLIAKIPLDRLKDVRFLGDIESAVPPWVLTLTEHCRRGIEKLDEENSWICHKYSDEDASDLKDAFLQAKKTSPPTTNRTSVPG